MNDVEEALLRAALDELEFSKVLSSVAGRCLTAMGQERVLAMRPGRHAEAIRTDLQRVQEVSDVLAGGDTLPYERLADIRPLMTRARIEGNYLSAGDLLAVGEALATSRSLRRFFHERGDRSPAMRAFVEPMTEDRMLERHINDAVDETGTVRDNASRELQSIRRDIADLSARLRSRLQKILRKFGEDEVLQDDFVTQRDGRFVLPVRVENKRSVEGIIHGVSASGSTVFMEPAETFDMNNDLSLLHNRELREIQRILVTLTAEVAGAAEGLVTTADILIDIDTLQARARHAIDYGGIQPTIVDDDMVELVNVHHPVLRQQAWQTKIDVVPLRVSFDGTTRGILISGPNAGGKTVAMKTIGLSLAMAMSGMFPLGMCTTNVRRLFTAIGDHQSIDSNLSTFSSQIIRLRDILSYCASDALVFIDEICAGTDPAEGGALAAGILDSLLERRACFVVTTHQSSLKQYALTRPGIRNASLAFDETKMMPTFRFLNDVPGNSYAFVLAKNVGLPDVVVERARGYLGDRHDELERSIAAMQRFRTEAETLHRDAAAEAARAERLRKDYEDRLRTVQKKKNDIVDEAENEARELLREARALVENTIREVREQQKAPGEVKKEFERQRDAIERKTEKRQKEQRGAEPAGADIVVGSTVSVSGTSSVGDVVELDAKAGTALVDVNGIRFRFPLKQLQVSSRKASAPSRGDGVFMKFDARVSADVRGMRADEALKTVEVFISDGILGNLTTATIIHGKGTGALRKVIHDYLHEHPQVRSYRVGTIEEGGDGVTILEFS